MYIESKNMLENDSALKLFKVGKVKEVYELNLPDMLEFKFTDNISVFDFVSITTVVLSFFVDDFGCLATRYFPL